MSSDSLTYFQGEFQVFYTILQFSRSILATFGKNHYNGFKGWIRIIMIGATKDLNVQADDYALLTDLYQLTMTACYVGEGIANKRASFELFTRRLPHNFGYLIAMGLEQALEYLEKLQFSAEQIKALQETGLFKGATEAFWDLLREGRFTGDVWAVPEGTAISSYEPILRIDAPLWQAQIVETYLLNTINYQTLIATKAARLRDIAGDEAMLLEFGTRRAFSPQASLWAARAAIAGGLDTTSNVLAALKLGQKPAGTLAHSLIMAFQALGKSEEAAFTAFARYFPTGMLLIDTVDVIAAAQKLAQSALPVTGVRIDSGNLRELTHQVREILPKVDIFVSGDIDEWEIERLKQANCPINGYGIGTKLVTGEPINGVYKLVEIEGIPTAKQSENKFSYPGKKQIFRGERGDRLALMSDPSLELEKPLLQLVMKEGQRIFPSLTLEEIRLTSRHSVQQLPLAVRKITNPQPLTVNIATSLVKLKEVVFKK